MRVWVVELGRCVGVWRAVGVRGLIPSDQTQKDASVWFESGEKRVVTDMSFRRESWK